MNGEPVTDQKRGHRFNWFDRLLFLLIAGALVGAFFTVRYLQRRSAGEEGRLTYTVLLSDIDPARSDAAGRAAPIAAGDTVRSQNGTVTLGRVTAVQRIPHRAASAQNGTLVFSEVSDRVDYRITVSADASRKAGDGIRVGDIRISAGGAMTLCIGDFFAPNIQVLSVVWEAKEDA